MIKVGCCGFPVKRDIYYRTFPVVEIQQTFYQLPRMETARRWMEEAPPDFEFTMKAWQLITHQPSSPTYRRLRIVLPEEKKKNYGFFKATEEVDEAWRMTAEFAKALGVKKILFQSPASFEPSIDHIKDLKTFFKKIERKSITFIWEPRGGWERMAVERLCKELGILPCLDIFSSPLIKGELLYVRLHGKTGYRYNCSGEDMKEILEKGAFYMEAYILFNNLSMYEDACLFKKMIGEENGKGYRGKVDPSHSKYD